MSLFNRAEVVDQNFTKYVKKGYLPPVRTNLFLSQTKIRKLELISIFESQVLSRHMDLKARLLNDEGECYYTIGSSGHEGNAVFGKVFPYTDMAFLHYRSGSFFIERSKQVPGSTPIYDMALSFMASSEDPISGGRHKVLGSKRLNIPPQTSTIASHLPKAVGTAFSIDRARNLDIPERKLEGDSIVLCSFGDASTNHATALSAFNTAGWISHAGGHVPIVFICEDNETGISVPTEAHWIKNSFSNLPGMQYIACDGLHLIDLMINSRRAEHDCRINRSPIFLHMKTVRLMGHAGSDVEVSYRPLSEIEATEFNDPLLHSARILIENQCLSAAEILKLYEISRAQVNHVFEAVTDRPKLDSAEGVMEAITANGDKRTAPKQPAAKARKALFGKEFKRMDQPHHMAKLINYALSDILLRYKNTLIFGEDVAQKGGVYHVTADLYKQFGVRRVFNSPLDETSIIGFGIGFGHNGFVPIPEIQFLAYLHNAEDQLRGEAATLPFFSEGQFTNPMVLRVPGLAYQKGFGGHFHNDNSLAIFRDIPGVILAVPSNGADAAKMLRTAVRRAHENGRVVIFVEPIALYMTKDLHTPKDGKWNFLYPDLDEEIPVGDFAEYGKGKALTIITYGNGLYLSLQAKKEIEKKLKKKIKVIDLRWLSNIDIPNLLKAMNSCKNVLIVDECRRKGCHGEGLLAQLVSENQKLLNIKLHAAEDSFISLGVAATATLPSKESIIQHSLKLVNG
ncbi:MAG: thiamine pyrophosphate-dependent enzyme [Candidatus Marinimicrobia bacterium]|nr:thiamine pyrophosphate-dependent enzyme [Candidatus Neomarinimicrobiota bacterium]